MRIRVGERTPEPAIGDGVPASEQLVLRDVDDIATIDTSATPRAALHEQTIAEALDRGRPLVIAFATPLFCQTRLCGPVVDEVVAPVWERYGDRIEVLHIEPYDVPLARSGQLVPVPAMLEWHLDTEPWVFVLDSEGRVVAKFEGIMSLDEVTAAVELVLGEASD